MLSPETTEGDEDSDDDSDDDVMDVSSSGGVGDAGIRRVATAALDLLNDEQLVLRLVETVTQVSMNTNNGFKTIGQHTGAIYILCLLGSVR